MGKNMIPIHPFDTDAGHIKITSQYGVHTLEIYRAGLEDAGTYRMSAQNCKGEVSSFATLVVKRYQPGRQGWHTMGLKKTFKEGGEESENEKEDDKDGANKKEDCKDKLQPSLNTNRKSQWKN